MTLLPRAPQPRAAHGGLRASTLVVWDTNGVPCATREDRGYQYGYAQCPPALAVHLRGGCRPCLGRLAWNVAASGVPELDYGPDAYGWVGFSLDPVDPAA